VNARFDGRDEATPLAPDLGAAHLFLRLLGLDPAATKGVFQTFDDAVLENGKKRGNKALAVTHAGTFDELAQKLVQFNDRGAGVFITANATDDSGRRRAENIVRPRAIWHEDDSAIPRIFPLEPNLVVETLPGKFHRWWLVEGLTLEEHGAIMKTMVDVHGSDPRAADVARVLRLPGFYHRKGVPWLVKLVSTTLVPGFGGHPYPREEILKAFPSAVRVAAATNANAPTGDVDPAKLFQALGFISATDRKMWTDVGMAIHYAHAGSEEGRDLWATWSATSPDKYDFDDLCRVWKSFRPDAKTPTTIGTVYYLARQRGWTGNMIDAAGPFERIDDPLCRFRRWRAVLPGQAEQLFRPMPSSERQGHADAVGCLS